MKTPLKLRRRHQQWQLNNWPQVRAYQRNYMKIYRVMRPDVIKKAQAAYIKRNKQAFLMYTKLVELAKKDGMFHKTNRFTIRRRRS